MCVKERGREREREREREIFEKLSYFSFFLFLSIYIYTHSFFTVVERGSYIKLDLEREKKHRPKIRRSRDRRIENIYNRKE